MQFKVHDGISRTCGFLVSAVTSPLDSRTLIPWPLATRGPEPDLP